MRFNSRVEDAEHSGNASCHDDGRSVEASRNCWHSHALTVQIHRKLDPDSFAVALQTGRSSPIGLLGATKRRASSQLLIMRPRAATRELVFRSGKYGELLECGSTVTDPNVASGSWGCSPPDPMRATRFGFPGMPGARAEPRAELPGIGDPDRVT